MSLINEPNLNYFLSCATDPNVLLAPALDLISPVVNLVQGGLSQITSLGDQVDANLNSPDGFGPLIVSGAKNPAFASASGNLTAAVYSIMAIPNELLSCKQVDVRLLGAPFYRAPAKARPT